MDKQHAHYEHLWGKVGDWQHESPHFKTRNPQQETMDFISFLKKQGITQGKALDLGCGGGRHVIAFAQAGFDSTGIDFSETAIALARKDAKDKKVQVTLIVGDVLTAPLQKESYDIIHDAGCLHHLNKQQRKRYLQQVIHALKPGGYYKLFSFSNATQFLVGKKPTRRWIMHKGHYTHFFSKKELEDVFSKQFVILHLSKESRKNNLRIFDVMYAQKKQ